VRAGHTRRADLSCSPVVNVSFWRDDLYCSCEHRSAVLCAARRRRRASSTRGPGAPDGGRVRSTVWQGEIAVTKVLATIALGAAGLGLVGPSAVAEPNPLPPGYHAVSVKKAGFSVAVPDSWAVLDLTQKPLKAHVKDLAQNHPALADYFSSDGFSHDTALPYTALFAADGTTTAPTPDNLRVEHYRQPGERLVDAMKHIGSTLKRAGLQDIEVAKTKVAGRTGIEATGFLNLGPYPVHESSYFVPEHAGYFVPGRAGFLYVLVFVTQADSRQDPVVQTMIQSFTLRR
jgi:hypothetical protein